MTQGELHALLRPHPPGTPMTDEILDGLAGHLLSDTDMPDGERAAWMVILVNVMKIVETLHGIRPK